jgi:Carboxypeptidase regulatory-like domain
MRRRRFLILPILPALLCVPVRAQQETISGAIDGRVVNERGEPMAGAAVSVRAVGTFAQGRSMNADAEGNFRFTGLEPALYTVSAYSPAYILQPQEADSASPYYRIGDSVRLEVIKGGVITGAVTNAAGEPVVGVRVRAFRVRDAKGKVSSPSQFGSIERSTDDRGIYRIYGLSPGSYLVTAGGGNNQSYQFNPFETDVPVYAPASTRDNATEYAVRSGEETTADIRYRSDAGHTISGTVKLGNNNSGAGIMIVSSDGMFIPSPGSFQPPGTRGFAINGLGDGEYLIYAQEMNVGVVAPTAMPDLSMSEPKRVTIKGADVSGIELIPKPLGSISGVVVLESSKAPECQNKRRPVFGEMLVELQRHEKDTELAPFMRMYSTNTTPNQKGAFSLRNMTPARYRFNPRFYARYWYLQSMSVGAPAAPNARVAAPRTDAAANWTSVKSGEQISSLTITLAEGAASIRGKIVVAEGETLPAGLSVYLIPAERDKVDDVLRYFVTQVDSDGAFTLNNLAPGRYFTLAQNPLSEEIRTVMKLRLPESVEARTKLRREAETKKSDVELKPCQTLTDYQLSSR